LWHDIGDEVVRLETSAREKDPVDRAAV
jgi:hypothetical protein